MEALLGAETAQVAVFGIAENNDTRGIEKVKEACQLKTRTGYILGEYLYLLGVIRHIGDRQRQLLDYLG